MVFLRPSYIVDGDVTDIDLDALKRDGIKGLIFDLDSTLIAPKTGRLSAEVEGWLQQVRLDFKVIVVSNNRHKLYMQQVSQLLQMEVIGEAAKPRRRGFVQAQAILGLNAQDLAVIGDRPLTDIWGGQRAGMKTILVKILKTQKDTRLVSFLRRLERVVVRKIE